MGHSLRPAKLEDMKKWKKEKTNSREPFPKTADPSQNQRKSRDDVIFFCKQKGNFAEIPEKEMRKMLPISVHRCAVILFVYKRCRKRCVPYAADYCGMGGGAADVWGFMPFMGFICWFICGFICGFI